MVIATGPSVDYKKLFFSMKAYIFSKHNIFALHYIEISNTNRI